MYEKMSYHVKRCFNSGRKLQQNKRAGEDDNRITQRNQAVEGWPQYNGNEKPDNEEGKPDNEDNNPGVGG